ncbi:MAG: substrate-binding domain-containing protein, partial [Acidobacteria bacterium]|nr:substrate-binding domain-containing protein [Acidobacteriota bacterium]
TTVRQPLRRMGELAARVLLKRIVSGTSGGTTPIVVEPELIMRESTAKARK